MFLIVLSILILSLLLYLYLNRRHGYIESLPFPMERPFLCFGSPPFLWHQRVHHFYYVNAFKRFKSKTFTRYMGSTPTITTIDPNIIKEITVKQFDHFPKTFYFDVKDKNMTLDISSGPVWKFLRKEMSPVFTSGKLKGMMEPIDEITNRFMEYIQDQSSSGKSVFIKEKFQGLTLDVINACAYGIQTNSSEEQDHELLILSKKMLADMSSCKNGVTSILVLMISLFPGVIKYMVALGSGFDGLIQIANSIIHQREKESIKKNDFINVLMDMRKNNRESPNELINDEIITAQAVIFFVAGYATTSHTLCSLIYVLATHPEIQEELYQSLLSVSEENHDPKEHSSSSLYTIAVIKETMRMYPAATMHTRVCSSDTEVEGIPIKKGTFVEMPIYASHFHPEFFPSPEEFKPERFFKENSSQIIQDTYRPFGDGNRMCIGYRFAMMELQLMVEKMVKKFQILPTHETKIVHSKGSLFFLDTEDIGVRFVPRDE